MKFKLLSFPILLFSRLPLWILYGISDLVLFPLMYYVLAYRKKVVIDNLERCFPEKSKAEKSKIMRDFYHYLSDLFIETIKSFTISKNELIQRFSFDESLSVLDELYAKNQSMVLTLGHYGNYEWFAIGMPFFFKHHCGGPYHEMSNSFFDRLFLESRKRFGMHMYPTYKTMGVLRRGVSEPYVTALANDQFAPPEKCYWGMFMGQETSFFVGTEKIAKDLNLSVVFCEVTRPKRGKYHIHLKLITEKPQEEPIGYIMDQHALLLENQIKEDPSFWLWTHRRWKVNRPAHVQMGFTKPMKVRNLK